MATTEEIIKEFASRAKDKRKHNIAQYGTQKQFAQHIRMSFRSYQEFEISWKITLEKFVEDTQQLLKVRDEQLFEEKRTRKKLL